MAKPELVPPMDKFKLLKMIGSGAFSNVYIGQNKENRSTVAIKLMADKHDKNYMYYAAQEIALLNIMKHPNIVPILEYSFVKKCIAFSMPCMCSFKDYLNETGSLLIEELKLQTFMRQLVDGVFYMHSLNIMHSDLKTSNILIDNAALQNPSDLKNLNIKICDFGLSVVTTEKNLKNVRFGSLEYMAPEKILNHVVDAKSDWYSVGVIMFECLFLRVPINIANNTPKNKINWNINYPAILNVICEPAQHLLINLLQYDKEKRISKTNLQKHNFLQFKPHSVVVEEANHYIEASTCVNEAANLEKHSHYGQSYVKYRQAILHLEIFITLNTIPEQIRHIEDKIIEYHKWSQTLEDAIKYETLMGPNLDPLEFVIEYGDLKKVVESTPALNVGIDLCCMAEMYLKEQKYQESYKRYMDGIGKLISLLENEPRGHRKNIIGVKLNEWLRHLEFLKKKLDSTEGEQ